MRRSPLPSLPLSPSPALAAAGFAVPLALVFRADGTCASRVVSSLPGCPDVPREVKASWTRRGPAATMTWEGAGTTTGTLEGSAFTMKNEGMLFLYRSSR